MKRFIFAACLAVSLLGPLTTFAQAPPAVPALPDTERRTSYSISTSTCVCAVNFALYGDGTDYYNWLEVWLNGTQVQYNDPVFGWSIASPTGTLSAIPRPITDALLTFNNPQTGTVQIVGARRPRQLTQFTENRGVAARDLNQRLTDITASEREIWDKINDVSGRGLFFAPGNITGPMPTPSKCAGAILGFDATGLNPTCQQLVSGTLAVPVTTTTGHLASWGNPTGTSLLDSGVPAAGVVTGPGSSTNGHLACWNGSAGILLEDCGGLAGVNAPLYAQVRLTLTQGTPITSTDVTGATSVYLEPCCGGNQLSVYDGVSQWTSLSVAPSTYSLPLTQSQTCTLAGTTTVTGCSDTSQLVVGQQVTGTNIPSNDTIATIVGSSTFTLANAATGSGSTVLTFKVPPSTAYDIFAINNGGAPKLIFGPAWTVSSGASAARATGLVNQNGALVLSGATNKLWAGSIYTTTTAGQTEDSALRRFVYNAFNAVDRTLHEADAAVSWNYSTASFEQCHGSAANQVEVMLGSTIPVSIDIQSAAQNSTATVRTVNPGIGVDSVTQTSANWMGVLSITNSGAVTATTGNYTGSPGIGHHYFSCLEQGAGSDTQTWFGTSAASPPNYEFGLKGRTPQ